MNENESTPQVVTPKKAAPKKAAAPKAENKVITVRSGFNPLAVPDLKQITTIKQVAGKNIPATNLKDHNEYDGQDLIVTRAKISEEGTFGAYTIMTGFVVPQHTKLTEKNAADYAVVLMTGSENVFERMVLAIEDNAFPVQGRLRRAGRAWFLD